MLTSCLFPDLDEVLVHDFVCDPSYGGVSHGAKVAVLLFPAQFFGRPDAARNHGASTRARIAQFFLNGVALPVLQGLLSLKICIRSVVNIPQLASFFHQIALEVDRRTHISLAPYKWNEQGVFPALRPGLWFPCQAEFLNRRASKLTCFRLIMKFCIASSGTRKMDER